MSEFIKRVKVLVAKDIKLEIRQQYTFYGILLYVLCTIFIIYLSLNEPEEKVWNALFWITQLFICVNAVAKSFLGESKGRMLYYFSIVSASEFIVSKIIFNGIIVLLMSLLSFLAFTLLLGNPLVFALKFLFIALLGGVSLSFVFTFLAAIAAKAQQSSAIMTIMGFPLIIPQVLLLIKVSSIAFSTVVQSGLLQMILLIFGLDIMIVLLSLVLFPYLWKE